jgi:acyl carrier protein
VTDIGAEFRDILVFHLSADETKLTENVRLVEDLGADSLDLFEVVVACEEKFGIDIPNDAAMKFVTIRDALEYLEARVHAPKSRLFHTTNASS